MNVQMNVRIEEDLKAAGDRVFAEIGLTPTQVVRNVWEFASQHREEPAIVWAALQSSPKELARIECERASRELAEGSNLIAQFRERFGLPHPDSLEELDYEAMREQALYDRMAERGLE